MALVKVGAKHTRDIPNFSFLQTLFIGTSKIPNSIVENVEFCNPLMLGMLYQVEHSHCQGIRKCIHRNLVVTYTNKPESVSRLMIKKTWV